MYQNNSLKRQNIELVQCLKNH